MKKVALILVALMIIPAAAFGMEMMNDTAMDSITGQSGVSIAFDDVQLFINIDKMAYIDSDGLSSSAIANVTVNCNGPAGAIELDNFQIDVLNVNAIVASGTGNGATAGSGTQTGTNIGLYSVSCGNIPLFFDYASSAPTGNDYLNANNNQVGLQHLFGGKFHAQALSIDVTDKLPALTEGIDFDAPTLTAIGSGNVGGVFITLPTLEIYINNMDLTPKYQGNVDGLTSSAVNNGKDFGTFELDGITFTVLSGWMEIAPH